MSPDRRQFIKSVGVTLASLIVSGALSSCEAETEDESPIAPPISQAPGWEQVRQCWLDLGDMHAALQGGDWDKISGEKAQEQVARHRAALDALVAAGELDEVVARHIQLAFQEAAYHIERSIASCYIMIPFEHQVRQDLLQQADVLSEMSGDLDPATVAQARAAIAQDVAFFEAVTTGTLAPRCGCSAGEASRESVEQRYGAGELEARPEALEAARLLTELLLETSE